MAAEWREVRLRDVATLITKGTTPTTLGMTFAPRGINYIKAESVTDAGRIDQSKFAFIDAATHQALRRSQIHVGDLLMSMAGVYLGKVAVVPAEVVPANTNQAVAIIRPNGSLVDRRFVAYQLRSRELNVYINSLVAQSAQPNVNLSEIGNLPLRLPSLPEQRAIAHILGTLDDKIELNRRTNETLEAMARALFKSWFVDFDPVRAKAEGRDPGLPQQLAALFPSRFENSEMGEIPESWRVATISDLCSRVAMGPFGSDIKTDNFVASGVPVVRGGNLTGGFVEEGFVFVSDAKADQLRNSNAFPGDIVITHRGTLGQVGLIPERSRFPRYVVSQSQMLLSANPDFVTPGYLYEFLCSPSGRHALLSNTSQTGVPAIARPTSSVRAIQIVAPPVTVLKQFNDIVGPIYMRRDQGGDESRTLATLRDTLLPKLISGELRVKDAERIVEIV